MVNEPDDPGTADEEPDIDILSPEDHLKQALTVRRAPRSLHNRAYVEQVEQTELLWALAKALILNRPIPGRT